MSTVYFQGNATEAVSAVNRVLNILTGNEVAPNPTIPNGVYGALGVAALSDIKADFVRKADGATGEDGRKWKELSPVTIARRGQRGAAKLSDAARKKRTLQRLELAYYARLSLSLPPDQALLEAKRQAKATVDSGDTKLINIMLKEEKVKILRDTGVLLNSLSPGAMRGNYQKPRGDGGDEQVFDFIRAGIIVGTNVEYAATHQYGDESRNIPARPFLPDPNNAPAVWLERWAAAGETAVAEAITLSLEGRI